jgi:hypothetical protein
MEFVRMAKVDPILEPVIAALEDPRYQWRTVNGIAKQAGLTRELLGRG